MEAPRRADPGLRLRVPVHPARGPAARPRVRTAGLRLAADPPGRTLPAHAVAGTLRHLPAGGVRRLRLGRTAPPRLRGVRRRGGAHPRLAADRAVPHPPPRRAGGRAAQRHRPARRRAAGAGPHLAGRPAGTLDIRTPGRLRAHPRRLPPHRLGTNGPGRAGGLGGLPPALVAALARHLPGRPYVRPELRAARGRGEPAAPPEPAVLEDAWQRVAAARAPSGAIPEEGAAQDAAGPDPGPDPYDFTDCYHSTLMAAFAAALTTAATAAPPDVRHAAPRTGQHAGQGAPG